MLLIIIIPLIFLLYTEHNVQNKTAQVFILSNVCVFIDNAVRMHYITEEMNSVLRLFYIRD